jgi:hypothetical protein
MAVPRTTRTVRALGCIAAVCLFIGAGAGAGAAAGDARADAGFTVGVMPQDALSRADLRVMRKSGVDSLRLVISWSAVEAQRGVYVWSGADMAIGLAARFGLETLPVLFGSPSWATAADGEACTSGYECGAFEPRTRVTRAAFAKFAAAAARRYGPGGAYWRLHPLERLLPIRTWEIWNEENSQTFSRPAPDPRAYAALFRDSVAAIRGVDASAEVLVGGLASRGAGLISATRYLQSMLGVPGVHDSVDAVAVHPYAEHARNVFKHVGETRKALDDAGLAQTELWITEIGWASSGENRGYGLVKSRGGQALMLRRVLGRLMSERERWNLRGATWYAWRDVPPANGLCSWCPSAGLLNEDGSPKPALQEFVDLAQAFGLSHSTE